MGILTIICAFLVLTFLGVPIGFAIGGSVVIYFLASGYPPVAIILQQSVMGLDSFVLMALPLFMLMGYLMERGGSIDGLMELIILLLGRIPGGTAVANVVASVAFGAISGSQVATTLALGQIMEPRLVKQGYPKGFAAAIDCSAGAIDPVIPPGISLIVYAALAGVSIRDFFAACFIPGFIAAAFLIAAVLIVSRIRNYRFVEDSEPVTMQLICATFGKALPALIMPIVILGGIFSGIFTPTEAAAVGVLYAYGIGKFYYKKLPLIEIYRILKDCTRSCASLLFIVSAAYGFSYIMAAEKMPEKALTFFLSISQDKVVVLLMVNFLVLVLGCFMETVTILIILVPIMVPVMEHLSISPIHFGVVLMLNLAIGGITPPLGVGLFASCRILKINIEETFPHLFYFIAALIAAMLFIALVPETALWVLSWK